MVGRTAEVESLLAAYRETQGGATAVVVAGEAGIGKTRLVTEFVKRIPAARGCSGRASNSGLASRSCSRPSTTRSGRSIPRAASRPALRRK